MGEIFGLVLWLMIAAGAPAAPFFADGGERLWPRLWEREALYRADGRAVSTWRQEAARWLDMPAPARLSLLIRDGADLPRCVRLNNYWCVKRAGWAGEVAADREDHVAFASAQEGALVAALLLRRYYVDLRRKSALDIVSRWAPSRCAGPRVARAAKAPRRVLSGTLRGRWLARHRPGFTGRRFAGKGALPRSRVKTAPAPMLRAPTIAAGLGELPPVALAPTRAAGASIAAGASASLPAAPLASCASENARIDAYARKLAAGLGDKPTDDLALFDATGAPTPAFATALLNMAAVEIGPLRASPALIEEAVAAMGEALSKRKAAIMRAQRPQIDAEASGQDKARDGETKPP